MTELQPAPWGDFDFLAWGWQIVPIPTHGTEQMAVVDDPETRRHMIIYAGAISFSGFGMVMQAAANNGPDLVGIAALVTSVGGLFLGSVAAFMAWRKKPDPSTITIPAEMAERLFEHQQKNPEQP